MWGGGYNAARDLISRNIAKKNISYFGCINIIFVGWSIHICMYTDSLSQVLGRTKLHKKVSRNVFFFLKNVSQNFLILHYYRVIFDIKSSYFYAILCD